MSFGYRVAMLIVLSFAAISLWDSERLHGTIIGFNPRPTQWSGATSMVLEG